MRLKPPKTQNSGKLYLKNMGYNDAWCWRITSDSDDAAAPLDSWWYYDQAQSVINSGTVPPFPAVGRYAFLARKVLTNRKHKAVAKTDSRGGRPYVLALRRRLIIHVAEPVT